MITDGCFIYHKGSVSFKKLTTDAYHEIFTKNNCRICKAGVLVPAGDLIDLCFSGEYYRHEIMKKLVGQGGLDTR